MVVVAIEDAGETTDGVLQRNVLAWRASEDFGHEERLGQEALDLTSAGYQLLIGLGQFVHTEDRNDVLQLFVALQHVLNAASGVVMLLADHQRIQLTRSRV